MTMGPTAIEKFWDRVSPEPNSGCWLWIGSIGSAGYGQFYTRQNYTLLAHRASYEMFVGPIPKGLVIDHKCRTRSCVNPDHLEPVSMRENLARGINPNAAKTICKRGHALTNDNVYVRHNRNQRECRECCRIRDRARYRKKVV